MKAKSTTAKGPAFKAHNANGKGRSHKHLAEHGVSDGGGGHETTRAAKRVVAGRHPPGVGVADRQAPHKQREAKEVKYLNPRQILDEWCKGKRSSYK